MQEYIDHPPSTLSEKSPLARCGIDHSLAAVGDSHRGDSSKFFAVQEAYEAFCREKKNNPSLTLDSYAARYPDIQYSLANLIAVHQALDQNSELARKAAASDWPKAGEWFAHYQLAELIGRGGFSRVFLARDSRLGNREIVLKVTADAVREAQTLGRLQHPHVVPIHNVVDDPGRGLTGICMPYLGSATLLDLLDAFRGNSQKPATASIIDSVISRSNVCRQTSDERTPRLASACHQSDYSDAIVWIVARVADALGAAHSQGILHGDIKPSNILLARGRVPILLDFNLAQETSVATAPVGGTIAYMAPEQLSGSPVAVANQATDIFALATMTYEVLTGRHPFHICDSQAPPAVAAYCAILHAHQHGTLRFTSALWRTHPNVCRVVHKALSIDPTDRPSATELTRVLRQSRGWVQHTRRWLMRHPRRSVAVVASALLLAMTGIAFAVTREPYAEQQLRLAVESARGEDFPKASSHFTNLVRSQPEVAKHLLWRGIARARSGDLDLALQDFSRYEELTGGAKGDGRGEAAAGYWIYEMELFQSSKEPIFLFHKLDPALKKGFRTPELLHDLGVSLWKRSKRKEAIDYLRQALAEDPTLVEPHIIMFQMERSRLGDLSQAKPADVNHIVQLAETVISKEVPYANIHLQLATAFGMLAQSHIEFESQAVSCCRAAVENGLTVDKLITAMGFNSSLLDRLGIEGVLELSPLRAERIEFEPVLDPLKREWDQMLSTFPRSG